MKRNNTIKIKLFTQITLVIFLISNYKFIIAQPIFIENQGQFEENIFYKLKHNAGNIFFEKNKITYHLFQKDQLYKIKHQQTKNPIIKGHVYSTTFIGSNLENNIVGENKKKFHHNYFLGNDSSKWVSNIPIFNKVKYSNLYKGIDLIYYEKNGHLKYDFIVSPNTKTEKIRIRYDGIDNLYIKSGHLILPTSFGNIIEQAPMAYQYINNQKKEIKCKFVLKNNIIQFVFPDGYDKNLELIIDPVLIFSTYSGSTADNWGQTATYDNNGNLYAGSISFSVGYPTTTGAYQSAFGGGSTDICISKFSANGSSLLYSTYIGGSDNENPHSLIVNDNDELYLMGSSGSNNFPTTNGSYDITFNGGDSWGFINYGSGFYVTYPNGIDIIVTKFSSSGNNLIASTFVGGTKNDGINESGANTYTSAGLCNFYADEYRGEINLDNQGNCYIASTTNSLDFPTINASQSSNGGLQDAVIFQLDQNLSNLLWSTYYGGNGNDAAYSVQLNNNNIAYFTGGTMSNNLTTNSNSVQPNHNGGVDGFIAKFDPNLGSLLSSSYIGTNGYDQCYFVQIDNNDNIFLFGLTTNAYPTFPVGIYSSIGSQFIHKINSDLDSTLLSTTFGNGTLNKNITPSAFLVSDCGLIYTCGWGGLNGSGTTNNLPITTGSNNNAYQASTDGADFYLAVFEQDMQSILYATYFGGSQSSEHVDGGTSRFDKNGKVYQAVCAGCPGNNDFPSTPLAWSTTNGSSTNCNLGVFKFAFETINTAISIPNYYACIPNSYQFNSQSQGGNLYYWDFGDGNYSNLMNPTHLYTDTGEYFVSLVVSDSISCVISDTAIIQINVYAVDNAEIIGDSILCPNSNGVLTAYGGSDFIWSTSGTVFNDSSQQIVVNPSINTTYMVVAIDSCGSDTAYFNLYVYNDQYDISNDTVICLGDSIMLSASGGIQYRWYGNNIIYTDSAYPIVFPNQDSYYFVDITSANGCFFYDSLNIEIDSNLPNIILADTLNLCSGDSLLISPLNIDNALWSPFENISDSNTVNIWSNTESDITYYISSENSCGLSNDSIIILVFGYSGKAFGDTSICKGDSAYIYALDGINYFWYPTENLIYPDSCCNYVYPNINTTYNVIIENDFGCVDTFSVLINVNDVPSVNAGEDIWAKYGQSVFLSGNVNTTIYHWESPHWMSCYNCLNPEINPTQNTFYVLNAINSFGCINSDTVEVNLNGNLFVPNTFTPNDDGANDFFEIKGEYINNYEIWIYTRWGELVFNSKNINDSWDGYYKNLPAIIDGYIWKIEYTDFEKNKIKLNGHVNLIR